MDNSSQLRIARYRTRRNIIAVIQWIPFIFPIFGLRYLLQIQDNPEVHTLWLLLGLFFSSAFLVLVLSALWARCNVCGTRFPTFAWWSRWYRSNASDWIATKSMFPDYCPQCEAPVMAEDSTVPSIQKQIKFDWPVNIKETYRKSTQRYLQAQRIGLVIFAICSINLMMALLFKSYKAALYACAIFVVLVGSEIYKKSILKDLNKCPSCHRCLSEWARFHRADPEYMECQFCHAFVAPLFQ